MHHRGLVSSGSSMSSGRRTFWGWTKIVGIGFLRRFHSGGQIAVQPL